MNPVEVDQNGNYIINLKLALEPVAFRKLMIIVEVSPQETLQLMVAKYLSKELGMYNAVHNWVDKTVERVDNHYEGRDPEGT